MKQQQNYKVRLTVMHHTRPGSSLQPITTHRGFAHEQGLVSRKRDRHGETHTAGVKIGRGLGVHKEVGYIRRPGIYEGRINKESGSGLHTERVRSAHRGSVHTEGGSPVALGRSYLLTPIGSICLGSRPSVKPEHESLFNQMQTRTRPAASDSLCWHRVG